MADLKRVNTREFLRNINSMTEPVQVYSHSTLKGVWYPSNATWSTDMEQVGGAIKAIKSAMTAAGFFTTSAVITDKETPA